MLDPRPEAGRDEALERIFGHGRRRRRRRGRRPWRRIVARSSLARRRRCRAGPRSRRGCLEGMSFGAAGEGGLEPRAVEVEARGARGSERGEQATATQDAVARGHVRNRDGLRGRRGLAPWNRRPGSATVDRGWRARSAERLGFACRRGIGRVFGRGTVRRVVARHGCADPAGGCAVGRAAGAGGCAAGCCRGPAVSQPAAAAPAGSPSR